MIKSSGRRDQRFGCHMELWIQPQTEEEYFLVEVVNVSAGGMLLRSETPFHGADTFACQVELPQFPELIQFTAAVRHRKQEESGTYLLGINVSETQNIPLKTFRALLEAMFL
ncbi:MAG: PilZ domain-containing protein [Acidobacteria bacterium]|nr:PilZ domain-containing protein [Acidobacteriota bacterium]